MDGATISTRLNRYLVAERLCAVNYDAACGAPEHEAKRVARL